MSMADGGGKQRRKFASSQSKGYWQPRLNVENPGTLVRFVHDEGLGFRSW